MKRKLTNLPTIQLWMLMSFALFTNDSELEEIIKDEVLQRNHLGGN